MAAEPCLSDSQLRGISDVLGDRAEGLTHSEITELLSVSGIPEPDPAGNKRDRLFNAFVGVQDRDGCANNVLRFILQAMDPVRYMKRPERFSALRVRLNGALAFCGFELREDGQLARVAAARTLSEVEKRADRLRAELRRRGVHSDVLKFCQAELITDNNYFHAVLEATKSVAEKIRQKAGLASDGAKLVDQAFGAGRAGIPLLAINRYQTETEKSEHAGFANLLRGLFGVFRNVPAHAPKIQWPIEETDAFDLLSLASYLHRRLDSAVRTRFVP